MHNNFRSIIVLIIGLIFANACGDDSGGTVSDSGSPMGNDAATGEDGGVDTGRQITLVATEFKFTPNTINARAGQTLRIKVQNDGEMEHSLEVELPDGEVRLDSNIAPGDSSTLRVDVPKDAGEFDFYCPITGHKALGMKGKLIVTK